jgi:hypothetical protein
VTDLQTWLARTRASVDVVLARFGERHGYQPDSNVILSAHESGGVELAMALAGRTSVPSAVIAFFDSVAEVSLPDVWNGYFLGPAESVVAAHMAQEPRWVHTGSDVVEVLVVGSDGGGALYCVSAAEPAPVFRLVEPSIVDGIATAPSVGMVRQVASDFSAFVDALALAVESVAAGREPAI